MTIDARVRPDARGETLTQALHNPFLVPVSQAYLDQGTQRQGNWWDKCNI